MGNKVYWGLGSLIILIGAFGFLLSRQYAEIQELKKGVAESEQVDEPNKQKQTPEVVDVPEVDDRPPPPDDGHEYVWHGDHWDRQLTEDTRDRRFYIYHINGIRYTIKRPETPEEHAELEAGVAALEKKVKEMTETNKQLSLQVYEVSEKLKVEHARALKLGGINRKMQVIGQKTREITSMLRSGEITPLEAIQLQRQIDESPDVQAVYSYVSTLKEDENDKN